MDDRLQDSIYYKKGQRPSNSCCIAFLKVGDGSTRENITDTLSKLWLMYDDLKLGKVIDLTDVNERHLRPGNLKILMGYGHKIFSLDIAPKKIPNDFGKNKKFKDPFREGGGPVVKDSRVRYSSDIKYNHANSDHVILQFLGDNEFTTDRALIETWKLLSDIRNSEGDYVLYISRAYTGFQRMDGRNWLGFHDGVSNIASKDRFGAIAIRGDDLEDDDQWTVNGTYMAFIRIEIKLDKWQKNRRSDQEIIIGRDKITGCPIVGVDTKGNPIKDPTCPIKGTFEVIEDGNETFREYRMPKIASYSPEKVSKKSFDYSHVIRSKVTEKNSRGFSTSRVFRQGYEFFEPIDSFPGFRVGLNFISFQNNPSTLLQILQEGFNNNFYETQNFVPLEDFFSVRAAGLFFIPPFTEDDAFPGRNIFLDIAPQQKSYLRNFRRY